MEVKKNPIKWTIGFAMGLAAYDFTNGFNTGIISELSNF
jgi:hypothetical protein